MATPTRHGNGMGLIGHAGHLQQRHQPAFFTECAMTACANTPSCLVDGFLGEHPTPTRHGPMMGSLGHRAVRQFDPLQDAITPWRSIEAAASQFCSADTSKAGHCLATHGSGMAPPGHSELCHNRHQVAGHMRWNSIVKGKQSYYSVDAPQAIPAIADRTRHGSGMEPHGLELPSLDRAPRRASGSSHRCVMM